MAWTTRGRILLACLAGAGLVWVGDALLSRLAAEGDRTLLDWLILRVPPHDLFHRLLVVAAAVGLGLLAGHYASRRAAAVARLRHDRARLLAMYETLPGYVFLVAPDRRIRFANATFQERFGDPAGKTCFETIHGLPAPCKTCPVFDVLETDAPQTWDWRSEDGRVYEAHDCPFEDVDGTRCVLELGLDVTDRRDVEGAVRRERDFSDRVVETAPAIVLVLDPRGRVVRFNRAMEQISGWPLSEAKGKDWFTTFLPPRAQDRVREVFQRVASGKGGRVELGPIMTRDGRERIIEWSNARLADAKGNVTSVLSVGLDVTEQQREEDERRRAEERLRLALRAARMGTWEWDIPKDTVRWSPEFEALLGYGPGGFPGNLADYLAHVHEEDREDAVRHIEAFLGQADPEAEYAIRHRMQRTDGQLIWMEGRGRLVVDHAGQPVRLVGVGTDVTALHDAEAEARESRRWYRDLFRHSRDGLVVVDAQGRILDANAAFCRMLGYTQEELQAKEDFYAITPERWRAWEREEIWEKRLLRDGYSGVYEKEYIRKDGTVFPVELQSYAVRNERGAVAYLWGVARDITERKAAEAEIRDLTADLEGRVRDRTAELEAANVELDAFAYSVSHDLRAPLRAMAGFSQALLADHGDQLDPQGRTYLERIRTNAARMGGLIDDLMGLAHASRQTLHVTDVDLSRLAGQVVDELRSEAPNRPVEVHVAPDLTARGDPHLVRILLTNLLENAWKFTGSVEAARIEVGSAGTEDGREVFFVRDSGVGFDPAYAAKLFKPFQRLHGRDEFPGSGVGLATVTRVAARHGGRVWAEGARGRGATFYFTLGGGATEAGAAAALEDRESMDG